MEQKREEGQRSVVRIGRFNVPYRVMGDGPTVLCSELPLNPFARFDSLQRRLASSFRVHVIDLRPVVGQSNRKAPDEDLLGYLSDFFLELADALEVQEFSVLGSFMFGGVAMEVARRAPDRVRTIVLVSTLGLLRLPVTPLLYFITTFYRMPAIPFLFRLAPFRALVEWTDYYALGPLRMYEIFRQPRNVSIKLEDLYEQYKSPRNAEAALTLMWTIRTLRYENLIPRLDEIRCPSLIIHGGDDKWIPPRYARELQSRIPDARLVVIPHTRHTPEVEDIDATTNAVATFLRRHVSSEARHR